MGDILDKSFCKLYQIVKVESADPKIHAEYRIQINKAFTYEECFTDSFVQEPKWEFVDDKVFNDIYGAIKTTIKLYDKDIHDKYQEYKKLKNSTVLEVFEWNALRSEVGNAIQALGGKPPKPPV